MRSAIGIDIGGTKTRVARVTEDGHILGDVLRPTPKSPVAVVSLVCNLVTDLDHGDVAAVGAGIPGRVDVSTGAILSGGFVDLSDSGLVRQLQRVRNLPVFVDNDAAMALFAEASVGAGRNFHDIVMLTIGTGIGGAIMQQGKIFHGHATAGQLGHLTVDMKGKQCACGRKGCIETTSSGSALRGLIAAFGLPETTIIEDLLADNSGVADSIIAAWAGPLRLAMDSLVAVLDPECIIVGGGLGAAACTAVAKFPAQSPWFQYPVLPAHLGDDAGVIGAALAALEIRT